MWQLLMMCIDARLGLVCAVFCTTHLIFFKQPLSPCCALLCGYNLMGACCFCSHACAVLLCVGCVHLLELVCIMINGAYIESVKGARQLHLRCNDRHCDVIDSCHLLQIVKMECNCNVSCSQQLKAYVMCHMTSWCSLSTPSCTY